MSSGSLVWRHYVRQQPLTVVLAKAKADIARAALIPVVVVGAYELTLYFRRLVGQITNQNPSFIADIIQDRKDIPS